MKNTVVLYYPAIDFKPFYPYFWAPLSILSVAAPLVVEGYKVILLDGNLGNEESDKRVVEKNLADCVCFGISSMIGGGQLERGLEMSSYVKSLSRSIPIVFGGPLGTVIPETLFNDSTVDYVVRGQGEYPFLELVKLLQSGRTITSIAGVVKRGDIEISKPAMYDKESLPPYPWHLLDVERYVRQDRLLGKRVMNFISSQGCPHRCGYCSEVSSYGSRWKALTADRMLSEVSGLVKKYNLDGIKFYDSNFFVDRNRVVKFAQGLIDNGINISWAASAHPKGLKRLSDDLELIRESGLKRLLIGAESGSQASLNYINKGCTTEDIMDAAKLCAKYDISSAFTFIVGMPGISDDVKSTLEMALRMKKLSGNFEINIHFYAPLPGTPLYEEAKKLGYTPPSSLSEWSRYNYYAVQIPWLDKKVEKNVRLFGDLYSDFLYPPEWFLVDLKSKPIARRVYGLLKCLVWLRCKIHFYSAPIEKYWLNLILGKNMLKRGD
ncbi:MAG: radical SAM protein [Patescibacteria group bacterium]|jgi:radical SAM superfamily enzyme YgiQ (UPF0313 family)